MEREKMTCEVSFSTESSLMSLVQNLLDNIIDQNYKDPSRLFFNTLRCLFLKGKLSRNVNVINHGKLGEIDLNFKLIHSPLLH